MKKIVIDKRICIHVMLIKTWPGYTEIIAERNLVLSYFFNLCILWSVCLKIIELVAPVLSWSGDGKRRVLDNLRQNLCLYLHDYMHATLCLNKLYWLFFFLKKMYWYIKLSIFCDNFNYSSFLMAKNWESHAGPLGKTINYDQFGTTYKN